MFKHISRRLGALIIIFICFSLALLSYVYFIRNNKSSADVTSTEEVGASRESVFVSACSDPLKCQGTLWGDTLHFIQNPILSIFINHIEPKLANLTNSCTNQINQAGIKPDNLPSDGHVVIGGCDLTFQKVNDPIIDRDLYKVLFNLTVDKTVKDQLPTTYRDNSYDNSGLEKIDIIFKTNREQYVYLSYLPESLRPGFGLVTLPAPEIVRLSGTINSPFIISINGKEDMKNYLQLWNDNSDVKINLDNSYWYSKSEGEIDGFINASFNTSSVFPKPEEIKLDKLEVCPQGCSIKLLETLEIKAQEADNNSDGKPEKDIYKRNLHKSEFIGTGRFNNQSQKLEWVDVNFDERDYRKYEQTNYLPSGKSGYSLDTIDATNKQYPLSKINEIISTQTKKVIYPNPNTQGAPIPDAPEQGENNLTASNEITETTNTDGFHRTGKGNYQSNNIQIEGIYDDESATLMKVTLPPDRIDQRVDPLADVPNWVTENIFSSGSIDVPNKFITPKEINGITVLKTKPTQLIPAVVYLLESYEDSPRDKVFPDAILKPIYKIVDDLENKGAKVIRKKTDTKSTLLSAFKEMENNETGAVWVINLGHGSALGLKAGDGWKDNQTKKPEKDTNEGTVLYTTLDKILQNNLVKINVFAGYTCYSGRAPFAEYVIGSIGTELGSEIPSLYTIIGFGGQPWTMSISDVSDEINKITGCSQ